MYFMNTHYIFRSLLVALLIAIMGADVCYGQYGRYNFTSSLGFGSARPLGQFSSMDADLPSSGGAASGFTVDFESRTFLSKPANLGTVFMVKNQFNGLSSGFIKDAAGGVYNISYGSWSLNGYLVGAFYDYKEPSNQYLSIQPKLLFGLLTATDPSMHYYYRGKLYYSKYEAEALAFSSLLGLDVSCDIGRIHLQASYDFLLAKPTFNPTTFDWISYSSDVYSYAQKMRTYSFKVSLGYNFGKRPNVNKS